MIGSKVEYKGEFGERKTGKIFSVESDELDEVMFDENLNGETYKDILYWSKKTKSWRPVREKMKDTLFLAVQPDSFRDTFDFVLLNDIKYL